MEEIKITIKDIARIAGVSPTTVSQILNNKGERFSQETREKVIEVVKKNNYKPDFFAQNMVTKRSKTIGMIVPDVTDLFFSKLIEGVETYLESRGYMILLCNSKHSAHLEERYLQELLHRSVEGIILATPNLLSSNLKKEVTKKKIPLILVDRGKNKRKTGRLLVNEYEGAYHATEFLVRRGHRRIAFIKEKGSYYRLTERKKGYEDCLSFYQIERKEELIVEGELTLNGGYKATQRLLEQSKFTALFCSNDQMAVGAYQAIYEKGLQIPEDISVIGFDDLEISRYLAPSLTTIKQPIFEIGLKAAELVIEAIKKETDSISDFTFSTKLIERDSVTHT